MSKFFDFLKSVAYAILGLLFLIAIIAGVILFFAVLISFGGALIFVVALVALFIICFDTISDIGKRICR